MNENQLVEEILDHQELYVRVSTRYDFNPKGNVTPDAFRPRVNPPKKKDDCGCKSSDWCKYSSPPKTIDEAELSEKPYTRCAILNVGSVRKTELMVRHKPSLYPPNKAHAVYHTKELILPTSDRPLCSRGFYKQPTEQQLDGLAKSASIWPPKE